MLRLEMRPAGRVRGDALSPPRTVGRDRDIWQIRVDHYRALEPVLEDCAERLPVDAPPRASRTPALTPSSADKANERSVGICDSHCPSGCGSRRTNAGGRKTDDHRRPDTRVCASRTEGEGASILSSTPQNEEENDGPGDRQAEKCGACQRTAFWLHHAIVNGA